MNESSERFDEHAAQYAASELHKNSPTIARLHELVRLPRGASVCDVACGPGHVALSFAGRGGRIVGVDPAPKMLAAFSALAKERGVAVECVQSFAESMPLADASFELVTTRLAAHHFKDVQAAVNEMARIVRPGGRVAVIDLVGYDDPAIDAFNHDLEMLHDPTHGRSYRVEQWRRFLEHAGLVVDVMESHHERPQGISIEQWCQTTKPGADAERALRAQLAAAPDATLRALHIRADGSEFYVASRTLLAIARKP